MNHAGCNRHTQCTGSAAVCHTYSAKAKIAYLKCDVLTDSKGLQAHHFTFYLLALDYALLKIDQKKAMIHSIIILR